MTVLISNPTQLPSSMMMSMMEMPLPAWLWVTGIGKPGR